MGMRMLLYMLNGIINPFEYEKEEKRIVIFNLLDCETYRLGRR